MLKKISRYITHPHNLLYKLLNYLINSPFSVIISDNVFLKLQYRLTTSMRLRLVNPVYFNEKIQWLKLHDRKPDYTQLADKYNVRKYISETIGEKYLFPLLGVFDSFEDISFDKLPNQFVIKCTHDSGSIVICQDKDKFNIDMANRIINKSLKHNYYYHGREWVYKNIIPRIIIEKYMIDESATELKDYKIFCFNGHPKIIQVDFNRFTNHKRNFYSLDWEFLSLELRYPAHREIIIEKPVNLSLMLQLAGKLSQGFPFLRVDFYSINQNIYFGELTFYPENGMGKFNTCEWDLLLGSWIELPV